jgi:ABC-type tungstate transport system permease subunit
LRIESAILLAWNVLALGACAESLAPSKSKTLRLAVDRAYEESGLAKALRAGFEQQTQGRLELVFGEASSLEKAIRSSSVEAVMTSRSEWVEKLQTEGLLINAKTIAHEELVFIGPSEDKFRSHGVTDPVEFLRSVIRSSHLYLRAAPGSAEAEAHARLARSNGDRPGSGSQIQTKLHGVAFVKEVVRRRAFGLVRRSALILAAAEGVKPNRVYQDGKPELVLPVVFHFLHPSKTQRAGADDLAKFLQSDLLQSLVERVGVGQVGLPFYAVGLPKEGQGAGVPQAN